MIYTKLVKFQKLWYSWFQISSRGTTIPLHSFSLTTAEKSLPLSLAIWCRCSLNKGSRLLATLLNNVFVVIQTFNRWTVNVLICITNSMGCLPTTGRPTELMLNINRLDCTLLCRQAVRILFELNSDWHFINEEALSLIAILLSMWISLISTFLIMIALFILQTFTGKTTLLETWISYWLLPHTAPATLNATKWVSTVPLLLRFLNCQHLIVTVLALLGCVSGSSVTGCNNDWFKMLEGARLVIYWFFKVLWEQIMLLEKIKFVSDIFRVLTRHVQEQSL